MYLEDLIGDKNAKTAFYLIEDNFNAFSSINDGC